MSMAAPNHHVRPDNAPIKFYDVGGAFGEFSNFAAFPVKIGGKTWPTSEHYFQAQKFSDKGHVEKIRKTASPTAAARMGRDRKVPLRKDWEAVKNALAFAYSLGDEKQAVAWNGGQSGSVIQSGTGVIDGCRQYKVSAAGTSDFGYVNVCDDGSYKN